MTKLLEQAVDAVRALPPEMQDDLARLLLQLAGDEQSTVIVTAAEAESLEESLEQASRREFATDEQVTSVWAKHDL